MKALVVIPARFQSSRFPGKLLETIGGQPLIQHVWERAMKSDSTEACIVATDDERIADACRKFGARVEMTGTEHASGSSRCAEVARRNPQYDIVVNVQGDEPFLDPGLIDRLVDRCHSGSENIATACVKIIEHRDLFDPSAVKVVQDSQGRALYFSRAPIPHVRDRDVSEWIMICDFYLHIGIYAFSAKVLAELQGLSGSPLEEAEKLEQLRWLESGYPIGLIQSGAPSFGIDTPADLERARRLWEGQKR